MTPALTHEDANARLLDLVYGDAEGADRAALEAHVAGCAQCKVDMAALGETHTLLRGTFEDVPVPPRAHARILEAAHAAVAAQAPAAAAAKPAPAKSEATSFWGRLRGKWTFPTLATVGAVAVAVLASKMFLDPNKAFEQMEERRAPAPVQEPAAASDPVLAQPRSAPAPAEPAAPSANDEGESAARHGADLKKRPLTPEMRGALERLRESGASGGRGPQGSRSIDDRLRGALGQGLGGIGKGSGAGVAANRGELSKAGPGEVSSDKPAKAAKPEPTSPARDQAYATPPTGWKKSGAAATAAAPVAPKVAASKVGTKGSLDDLLEGSSGGSTSRAAPSAPAAAAPPPPPSAAKRKYVAEAPERDDLNEAPSRAEGAPSPQSEAEEESPRTKSDGAEKKEKAKDASTLIFETLVRRADQLFTAHRWQESVAAYRDLLRRYPAAPPAPQWRTRIVQAQREDAAQEAASSKQAAPAKQ